MKNRSVALCLIEMIDFHRRSSTAPCGTDRVRRPPCPADRHCAVVGDRAWEAWMTRLSRPISNAEIQFFDVTAVEAGDRSGGAGSDCAAKSFVRADR